MVEETDTGRYRRGAGAIEIDGNFDGGFLGDAFDRGAARGFAHRHKGLFRRPTFDSASHGTSLGASPDMSLHTNLGKSPGKSRLFRMMAGFYQGFTGYANALALCRTGANA
jgi:hypothetical protein